MYSLLLLLLLLTLLLLMPPRTNETRRMQTKDRKKRFLCRTPLRASSGIGVAYWTTVDWSSSIVDRQEK